MPNEVFDDEDFQSELATFLSRPNAVNPDLPRPPPAHPQYITALLTGILRGVGRTPDVPPITKRVRDDVGEPSWSGVIPNYTNVWRRSSLWLLIRVAIQTSVDRSPLGHASYKRFMLFFICTLARDRNNANLSSDLLHLMSSKILRRLSKLGSCTPDWLSEMALKTCACLGNILDARCKQVDSRRPSSFRNPSQDELARDTQLSLLDSREYIRNALADPGQKGVGIPFHPSHRPRGTIDDLLSSNGSFFEDAYRADPDVTLYDIEQLVEQGIDDWTTCVTNVDVACAQLEILMDKYMMNASRGRSGYPEHISMMLLTAIELFVALDKLVVEEIPMLADYSPEIPTTSLERLLLRKATSLHRLSRAYQYLSTRQCQSRPGWSVLSNEFTEDSFAVRYYDQSPRLQRLKARIEEDATEKITVGPATGLQREGASLAYTHDASDGYQAYQQQLSGQRLAGVTEVSQSPLPISPLQAKVVVFELQCPACFGIWRSAATRILHYFGDSFVKNGSLGMGKGENLLAHVPGLKQYFIERKGPHLSVEIHFVYFYPCGSQSPLICHAIRHPSPNTGEESLDWFSIWQLKPYRYEEICDALFDLQYKADQHSSNLRLMYHQLSPLLARFVDDAWHTSNDILSAQMHCPVDFSLDEFTAFAQLRSGGSLQWLNILQGVRSRTLNFRRPEVHYLLTYATFQVGPLDLNTGMWIWHQELQDPFFCDTLLGELEDLFADVGAGSIDGVMMNTISLLLTRVLASSPGEGISGRAIALLQRVRRKTFNWVQELSYNLIKAPMNQERSYLLQDMAATCRSTFDVDPSVLHKLFHSAEDVDVLLSCAFLIHALGCMSNP